jgi:hypothetical protein
MHFSCSSFWKTLSEPTRHWSYPPQRPSQGLTAYFMIGIGCKVYAGKHMAFFRLDRQVNIIHDLSYLRHYHRLLLSSCLC